MSPFKWAVHCSTPGCPNKARHGAKCDACRESSRRIREEHRPTASARGYGREAWKKAARRQVDRQPYCGECGATTNLVADHVVPRRAGGTDDEWNLQTLCVSCNTRKGSR